MTYDPLDCIDTSKETLVEQSFNENLQLNKEKIEYLFTSFRSIIRNNKEELKKELINFVKNEIDIQHTREDAYINEVKDELKSTLNSKWFHTIIEKEKIKKILIDFIKKI